jgi:uncharacterized protein YqjF (DUF2071 family)
MIDRLEPRTRPTEKARGYHRWRSLLFMHWRVPKDVMQAALPPGFEMDLYEGEAYVGLVPFAMEGVRPAWSPESLAFRFLETNVRTYVTLRGRPGVFFFSLDAASRICVWAARQFWSLPYHYADMSLTQTGEHIDYTMQRRSNGAQLRVKYRLGELLGSSEPGSPEFFFLERYLMFTESNGQISSGQVYHTPYPAQAAEVLELHDDLVASAGLGSCEGLPEFTHYASGVDVEVFSLRREA